MRELIDVVAIQGRTLQVTAHGPQAVDPPTLAVATALRVFVRYPVLDRLVLSIGADEIRLSRGEIERLLGGGGFAALQDRQPKVRQEEEGEQARDGEPEEELRPDAPPGQDDVAGTGCSRPPGRAGLSQGTSPGDPGPTRPSRGRRGPGRGRTAPRPSGP